jgi:hypothetical protein
MLTASMPARTACMGQQPAQGAQVFASAPPLLDATAHAARDTAVGKSTLHVAATASASASEPPVSAVIALSGPYPVAQALALQHQYDSSAAAGQPLSPAPAALRRQRLAHLQDAVTWGAACLA